MPKHKILSQVPLQLREVSEELEKIKQRDKELNFRAQKTLEYVQQVGPLKQAAAKKLYKALEGIQGARLKDVHIKKLIDLKPKTADDVKLVLQGYNLVLNKTVIEKIVASINEHVKE